MFLTIKQQIGQKTTENLKKYACLDKSEFSSDSQYLN